MNTEAYGRVDMLPEAFPSMLLVVAAISFAFLLLFQETIKDLLVDWANDPDYGHGLLLLPIAIYLAWRSRLLGDWTPSRIAGGVILAAAVALFWLGTIAAEFFTRR